MRRRHWAVLAVVPALLSGCSALGMSPAAPGGTVITSPSGPAWIVVKQGSATPSPTPSAGVVRAVPVPVVGFRKLSAPAPMPTPSPTCWPNTFSFSKIAAADVLPSTTSAVVTWYNVGGYNLRQFRLTAISQDLVSGKQRDVGFVTVLPGKPCGPMSATVTGLSSKTQYVFSVDAVVDRKSGDGMHEATVARSPVVRTR